jgi:hypothetical protein
MATRSKPAPLLSWPELPFHAWRETRDTLHMWMQIIGKVKLALTPLINHWWNVPLFVSPRGFTTATMPHGERSLEIEFDFIDDVLRIKPDDGFERLVPLGPRTVADFYEHTMAELRAADLEVRIWAMPVEVENPIPFLEDQTHRSYDKEYVLRFWQIVAHTADILTKFRARFIGKASPVMWFWGTFDLAVNRYSGRRAPPLYGASIIEQEAHSHEVSSVGWWPGDGRLEQASFYSYVSPEPPGFAQATITTPNAYYNPLLKGFYLHYDDMRTSRHPEQLLLDFAEQTYEAAASLGGWNRPELERAEPAYRRA